MSKFTKEGDALRQTFRRRYAEFNRQVDEFELSQFTAEYIKCSWLLVESDAMLREVECDG